MQLRLQKILLFLIAVAMISCQKGITSKTSQDKKKVLTFSVWGTPEQIITERKVISAFEKKNPGVEINLLHITRDYPQKILMMAASGEAPDVIMTQFHHLYPLAAKGVLLDLTERINDPDFKKDRYYDLPWKAFGYKGRYYGLPRDISGLVNFYNKDMLQKKGLTPPKNWEEYRKICENLSEKGSESLANNTWGDSPGIDNFLIHLWGNGGDIFDDPQNPTKVTLNSSIAVNSLSYYLSLTKNGGVMSPLLQQDSGRIESFSTGRVGFCLTGRWMTPTFKNIKTFDWDVAPVPAGKMGRYTFHGGTSYVINAKTADTELAWRFIEFYTSEEATRVAVSAGRTTPAFKSLANSPFFLEQRPPENMMAFVSTMEYGRGMCYTEQYLEFEEEIKNMWERVLGGNETPMDGVENTAKRLAEILENRE